MARSQGVDTRTCHTIILPLEPDVISTIQERAMGDEVEVTIMGLQGGKTMKLSYRDLEVLFGEHGKRTYR